jgi:DNA-binding MarR family transcriptional regulator
MSDFAKIDCACTNLKKAARVVGRAYDTALAPAGLNSTQYAILVNVRRYQPISQARLAEHLSLERTTLYRAVDVMERNGWLRSSGTGSGVARALSLTRRGSEMVKAGKARWEQMQSGFVDVFGRERWDEFVATLDEIQTHFSEATATLG